MTHEQLNDKDLYLLFFNSLLLFFFSKPLNFFSCQTSLHRRWLGFKEAASPPAYADKIIM